MKKTILIALLSLSLAAAALPAAEEGPIPSGDRKARTSAAWVRDGAIYEVFTRSFSEEGSFREVEKALPRLRQLGVSIIWLMPIHRIGELNRKGHYGSPYATQDYYSIDPMYGTAGDLKSLVQQAHSLGMRVVIDIVVNHTGWDCVMMNQNPNLYTHRDGKIVPPVDGWSDVADLNYDNPETRAYITEMLKYWIRDFDLDGFRCDVANMIPLDFWEAARPELEKIKPEIMILAEGDWPQDHLKAFDLTYSWRFYEALIDVVDRGKPAAGLRELLEKEAAMFPQGALLMRFNDNHDKIRAVNLFGDEGALLTAGICGTVTGVPMLYNGQEIGDPVPSNDPALFEKYDILWDNHVPRMKRFQEFYGGLLALRAKSPALRDGTMSFLATDKPEAVLAYTRAKGSETLAVLANTTNRPVTVTVTLPSGLAAGWKQVFPHPGTLTLAGGTPVELAPYQFVVFGK